MASRFPWAHARAKSVARAVLRRPLRCGECHRVLGRVSVRVLDGRIVVRGAYNVRVDWETETALRFKHMQVSDCMRASQP